MLDANSGSCASLSCHISANSALSAARRSSTDCGASSVADCCTDLGKVCAHASADAVTKERRTSFFIVNKEAPQTSMVNGSLASCNLVGTMNTAALNQDLSQLRVAVLGA